LNNVLTAEIQAKNLGEGAMGTVGSSEWRDLKRPPDWLMSPERIAAVTTGPLSFSRQALKEFARLGCRMERLRLELDRDGKGSALYRLHLGDHVFHYFVVSNSYAEHEKTDHNTGENWDVMSALCRGEWTPEREALLARELPKQRSGRPDADTLVYARGNRSGRLFEHVVEELSEGRQPDADRLAAIGYILRTTSFVGNGLLGMRAFAGYDATDPLRRPYYAQICAAFLLREFVRDLVDAMALGRAGQKAATLVPEFRRALGIGNSAGPGLVYFVANHPRLVHHWTDLAETALAKALRRPVSEGQGPALQALLARAVIYLEQSFPDRNEVFRDPMLIAGELAGLSEAAAGLRVGRLWSEFVLAARQTLSADAQEVLHNILLELHPEFVNDCLDSFMLDETLSVDPAMTVDRLRAIVAADYGWLLELPVPEKRLFWYRSEDAPGDSRRGVSGVVPEVEFESPLDTAPKIHRLSRQLAALSGDLTVGEFLLTRPELSYIVSRVQSLQDMDYAEYRGDYTDPNFSRLIPPRLILSFYGMEKLDTQMPRSVRGVLLQGAPTARDIAEGRDGSWPFPAFPGFTRKIIETKQNRTQIREAAIGGDLQSIVVRPPGRKRRFVDTSGAASPTITVSVVEMVRATQKALQGAGLSFGESFEAANAVHFMELLHGMGLQSCLEQLAVLPIRNAVPGELDIKAGSSLTVNVAGRAAIVDAIRVGDYVSAIAARRGIGAALVDGTFGMSLLDYIPYRLAQRGQVAVLVWKANGGLDEPLGRSRVVFGAPASGGPCLAELASSNVQPAFAGASLIDSVEALLKDSGDELMADLAHLLRAAVRPAQYLLVCLDPSALKGPAVTQITGQVSEIATWTGEAIVVRTRKMLSNGMPIAREHFVQLNLLAEKVRVPVAIEELIADPGSPRATS
jgi:hypothetical protein